MPFAPSRLCLLALVCLCVAAAAEVRADTTKANLRVCLAEPVSNATVVMKGGSRDLALKQDSAEKECYGSTGVAFDSAKNYELLIKAPGYKDKAERLDTSSVIPGSTVGPPDRIRLEKDGPPNGGAPEKEPRPGIRVCVNGQDAKPVPNANVVLRLKGEAEGQALQPDGQGCYGGATSGLDNSKSYELLVKAEGYEDYVQPVESSKIQAGGVIGPIALKQKTVTTVEGSGQQGEWWRKWLPIAGLVMPPLLALLLLVVWLKKRGRASATPTPVASAETPGWIAEALKDLAAHLKGIKEHQEKHTQLLEKICERLEATRDEVALWRSDAAARVNEESAPLVGDTQEFRVPASAAEPGGEQLARLSTAPSCAATV
jgi:hypothetical protein